MKINILFNIVDKPGGGGGNQFLKVLKEELIKRNLYEDAPCADVILINSHHSIMEIIKLKKIYPKKIFVHRIDGPMRLYNNMQDKRDFIVNLINRNIADGTIFQSEWSKEKNLNMGLNNNNFEVVIHNASDYKNFNLIHLKNNDSDKIKLIATSWSDNINKGFETYRFLDNYLDFDRYDMLFIGNSPYEYKNIKFHKPMNSLDLSNELKISDIYITASKNEACSNAVIEALSCGLPVIAYASGSNGEIIGEGGELFSDNYELLKLLDKVSENINKYRDRINVKDISEIVDLYVKFIETIFIKYKKKKYQPKKLSIIKYYYINVLLIFLQFFELVKGFLRRAAKVDKEIC